ncbi:hypothetical protein WR25_09197 isoform F [Diploscapter pachys]|nr:hypothetical protein WR25_09197 isoform F [Diploscapter pachys]
MEMNIPKCLEAISEYLFEELQAESSFNRNHEIHQIEAEKSETLEDFDTNQLLELCYACHKYYQSTYPDLPNQFSQHQHQQQPRTMSIDDDSCAVGSSSSTSGPNANYRNPRLDALRSVSSSDTEGSQSTSQTSPLISPFSPFGSPLFNQQNLPNPYDLMASCNSSELQQVISALMSPPFPLMPLSAEVQRLLLENQLPLTPPANLPPIWNLPMLMQLQQQMAQEISGNSAKIKSESERNEEFPLDLRSTVNSDGTTPLNCDTSFLGNLMQQNSAEKNDRKRPFECSDKSRSSIENDCQKFLFLHRKNYSSPDSVKNGYAAKRNYSPMDLAAAVDDIRCGKLGTRRASVVYGIPRSTLRNKIYKIEAAEEVAGMVNTSRRRKPGGQSSAEKKIADTIEREKRSISITSNRSARHSEERESSDLTPPPMETMQIQQNESNGSPNSSEPPPNNSLNLPPKSLLEQLASGLDLASLSMNGISSLWQNLFNNQPMPFKSDPMSFVNATNGKHSSNSSSNSQNGSGEDWKKSRPKRGQYR